MHRTQISLQETQYRFLQQEAAKAHISLSSVIRSLVDNNMRHKNKAQGGLEDLIGIAEGTGEAVGRNHDHFLYGKKA